MLLNNLASTISTGELIETLWNVNKLEKYMLDHIEEELIETLWNVNLSCPVKSR